uniref:RING-type E3 ubiquitin transferase n=1 Tax=Neolamprologus brichardi TaxID=32507 RepID=A0A3Q4HMU6_NEOBR
MESLEKQLICPICLEMFTKPVVILPCQHNLCRKCANDVFQASNPYLSTRSGSTVTSGGRFRCPSCRHEVVLDRHGVYGLQRNLLVENIIDMYKQGSTRYTCTHLYHTLQHIQAVPLLSGFSYPNVELADCVSMLVGNNERIQAIVSQLEETCRAVDENGRRQKSKVCETFDHLFALLEEKKSEMTVKINAEQEEKLDYIRGLRRKYTEHVDGTAKLLETAIQTMDESEMALFLQVNLNAPRPVQIMEGSDTSHLDKVQHGYENMDHFTANFEHQRRALSDIDFIKRKQREELGSSASSTHPEGELLPQVEEQRSGKEAAVSRSGGRLGVSRAREDSAEQSREPQQHIQLHLRGQSAGGRGESTLIHTPSVQLFSCL